MNTIAHPVSTEAPRAPSKGPLFWLIASQVLVLLSLFPWVVVAGLALMSLDEGAEWLLAVPIYLYPLAAVALSVLAWRAYRGGRSGRAMVLATIPAVPALLLLFYIAWMASPVQ